MNLIWITFVLASAIVTFGMFVQIIKKWPVVASFFAGLLAVIAWEMPQLPALVSIAGNNIFALDIFVAILFVVTLTQIGRLWINMGNLGWIWLVFGVLLIGSLIRGIEHHSLGLAVNEFRSFIYVYATLTWAMTLNWTRAMVNTNVKWTSFTVGWSLVFVTIYHISLHGMGTVSGFVEDESGMSQTSRPLISGQAYALAICLAICVWIWKKESSRLFAVSSTGFAIAVIFSQQRSVWGILAASLITVFIFGKIKTKFSMLSGGFLLATIVGIIIASSALDDVLNQMFSAAENTKTYDGRVSSWQNLIDSSVAQGPSTVVFGAPMGGGYGRFESIGRWVEFAPHNWYLTVYLRVGVFGLLVLLAFILVVVLRALRHRSNMASLSIIVMMVVYGWSYSWIWYTGIITGWALVQSNISSDKSEYMSRSSDQGSDQIEIISKSVG